MLHTGRALGLAAKEDACVNRLKLRLFTHASSGVSGLNIYTTFINVTHLELILESQHART